MFTGKFKFVYLVIKVVISTVKSLKIDHKIDLDIIMTINLFLVLIDQILMIDQYDRSDINDRSIRNVLVFR